MESPNDIMSEHIVTNNYYQQRRMNVDPERNKINMDRAKTEINITCDHYRVTDKCQVRNISYEELIEYRERYWNCSGTINKRIFMATHLEVDRIDNDNKKDINITCYCPRNDGTLDIICQKSFISVLGVSKHKILGIGHAKLVNSECLYKEKRDSNRWKLNKNKNDNGLSHSNENSQNHSNFINENDSTMGSNMSENGTINMKRKLKYLNNNEDNGESNKSAESNRTSHHKKNDSKVIDENNEDDNAIFEPHVKKPKMESSYVIDDGDEDEAANIFQPVVELTEKSCAQRDEILRRPQLDVRKPNPNSPVIPRDIKNLDTLPPHMIRKQSAYESPEERMAARQKARAILENLHSQVTMSRMRRPPQFNPPSYHHPNQTGRPNQPMHPSWQGRSYPPNFAGHRNYPQAGYMGPENWQRTLERNIERNIRRRQRMQEVKIDCNHNLTRFCKVISIPHEDLVQFHNMYWNCQGLMEERIFLAKFMVVTPCNHRREMAIATRIPTSDGQLVEVCQKSFLSVVGITKHKVQAAARAKLKGTLFRGDGRGGFQKPRSPIEQAEEFPPRMQISNVMERYEQKESKPRGFKNNETIEIEDSDEEIDNTADNESSSNRNINFEDSQTGNGEEDEDDDSQILSVEDAFASGKLNYDEFRQNIERNRINEKQKAQITRLKNELNLYKRRAKTLMLERKHFLVKFTKLRTENIKLRKKQKKLNRKCDEKVSEENIFKDELKPNEQDQIGSDKTDPTEYLKISNLNSIEKQSKDDKLFNETNSIKNENVKYNEISETNLNLFNDLNKNEDISNNNDEIQNDIS